VSPPPSAARAQGPRLPGNTILDGIRQIAPHAQVTYSKDASTPVVDADVEIVAVGDQHHSGCHGPHQRQHPAQLQAMARSPGTGAAAVRVRDRDGGARPTRRRRISPSGPAKRVAVPDGTICNIVLPVGDRHRVDDLAATKGTSRSALLTEILRRVAG
jgi:hypothetical protein